MPGLVEIMKCFNQITCGGAGLPEHGRVAEILAEDASEVRFGRVLFRIKPIEQPPPPHAAEAHEAPLPPRRFRRRRGDRPHDP